MSIPETWLYCTRPSGAPSFSYGRRSSCRYPQEESEGENLGGRLKSAHQAERRLYFLLCEGLRYWPGQFSHGPHACY